MHRQIAPLVVFGPDPYYSNRPRQLVAFRLAEGSPRDALARIAAVWDRFEPRQPLRLTFLDNEVDDLYRSELRAEHLLTAFCALAIFVACIGLFGLATYTAEQREREIGVRKALGASVLDVLILLVRDLARPVLLAFLIAAPLSFVLTRTWLNGFAYRTDAAWQSLIFTAAVLAVAVVLAVGVRAFRSARTSPVESLAAE
jgi:putative ABC transport system permease protein